MIPMGIIAAATPRASVVPSGQIRVPVTVPAQSSDLLAFPVYVDLRDMPAAFWENLLNSDGKDIRAKAGDGTDLPFDLVSAAAGDSSGAVFIRTDLSASEGTTVYLHCGDATAADFVPAAASNGRNAVWSDYSRVWVPGVSLEDRTGVGGSLTVVGAPVQATSPLAYMAGSAVTFNSPGALHDAAAPCLSQYTIGASAEWSELAAGSVGVVSYTVPNSTVSSNRTTMAKRANVGYGVWNSSDGWLSNSSTSVPPLRNPTRINYTHDGTAKREFTIDGTLQFTDVGCAIRPTTSALSQLIIGASTASGAALTETFLGRIGGYVYLRPGILTDEWLAAEAANLKAPTSFYATGAAESVG